MLLSCRDYVNCSNTESKISVYTSSLFNPVCLGSSTAQSYMKSRASLTVL